MLGLAEQRRSDPGDDLLSILVAAQDRGEIGENNLLAVVFGRTRRQHRHEHRADPLQPGGVRREP